jgi:phosphonate transport system substrate-binding protein
MENPDGACCVSDKAYPMKRKGFRIVLVVWLMLCIPLQGFCGDEILIGLIPEENIFHQMDRHKPLAAYLSEKLGIKVRMTILSRYGDIIDRFSDRHMDGAFFGVFTGVLAMEKLQVEPIARPVRLNGKSTEQGYIFVRKDSGIRTVTDMKGKRIVFVDRATVTGYLFAIAYLRENGVNNVDQYFREYSFVGSHDSVIHSVLDNRADIGMARSSIFNMLIAKDPSIGNELVVIAQSGELPETTLCLRKDLSADIKSRIRDILLGMDKDPKGREVLKKFEALRFIPAAKGDYRPFFEMAKKANIDLKSYRYK